MKAGYALAPLLVALAAAQDFSGMPTCALSCLTEFIPQAGCALTDTACQCATDTQAKLQGLLTPCLLAACSVDEVLQVTDAASSVCAGVQDASTTSTLAPQQTSNVPDNLTSDTPTQPSTTSDSPSSTPSADSSSTPPSTQASNTASGSSTTTPGPDTTGASSPSTSSSGLNPAAIGLGVGIGVGGLAIVLAALFFLWRRRTRQRAKAAAAAGDAGESNNTNTETGKDVLLTASETPAIDKAELPAAHVAMASKAELAAPADQTQGRAEAPPNELRHEVETHEGVQGRHELAGQELPPPRPA